MKAFHFVFFVAVSLGASVGPPGACSTSVAAAQGAPRLTDRGRTLLAGSIGVTWSNDHQSAGVARWAAWVTPSLLCFVHDRLGIGGYLHYEYAAFPGLFFDRRERVLGLGAQSAYELVLAPRLGLLLTGQLGLQRRWRTIDEPTAEGADPQDNLQQSPLSSPSLAGKIDSIRMGGLLPLLLHLNESIGVGIGPYFFWDHYFTPTDPRGGARYNLLRAGVSSWIGGSF
ncbi:MAG: hypothetical protein RL033_6268 [Pseudomonadota bacterium]